MGFRTVAIHATTIAGVLAVASALCAGAAEAKDYNVKVAIPVSTRTIELQDPAGAQKFYARIRHAADVACTDGNRADLKPVTDVHGCVEAALGEAVRTVNSPLLTQVYLETHTLRQALAHGIEVPGRVVAK